MKADRNLEAWAQEEENLINDTNNLSQAQWDRRELALATDPEAYDSPTDLERDDWAESQDTDPIDCPF
mgnify:FL=1